MRVTKIERAARAVVDRLSIDPLDPRTWAGDPRAGLTREERVACAEILIAAGFRCGEMGESKRMRAYYRRADWFEALDDEDDNDCAALAALEAAADQRDRADAEQDRADCAGENDDGNYAP